jgi:sulfonate transport system substrate-binding protein
MILFAISLYLIDLVGYTENKYKSHSRRMSTRKLFSVVVAVLTLSSLSGCARTQQSVLILRVGYQKWGTFSILKASGQLTKSLEGKGIKVEWIEFPAGPPLLEALNAGSIDLGHTGDSPPLFAQAADIPFVYFAASSASPESSAILVKRQSDLRKPADLRGRRIGFAKGTSAHTMVLRYIEKNGLALSDITAIYLAPADGRAALESGSIDAWSIWDPYLAAAEESGGYRELSSGKGYVDGREFYLASRQMIESQPGLLKDFLSELEQVKSWAKARPDEVNGFLSTETGIPLRAVALAESRRNRYETQALTEDLIASQQSLADRYFEDGLLPKKIDVRSAVFTLAQ